MHKAHTVPPYREMLLGLLILAGLYATSQYSYLLFHSVAELFAIAIATGTFLLAWNVRRFLDNNYLLFVGIAYLFCAFIEVAHTLAYRGMGVFPQYGSNLATQLWLAWRYLQSLSLLVAPAFLVPGHRMNLRLVVAIYFIATATLFASVFAGLFPTAYIEGVGLTPFKVNSEYVISGMFLGAAALLYRQRERFANQIWRLLMGSLGLAVAAELMFTRYVGVYDYTNLTGHLLHIGSYYLFYRAIIETGLRRPLDLLFRNLEQTRDGLEVRVAERTAALSQTNARLAALHDIEVAILEARSPAAIAQGALHQLERVLPCTKATVVLEAHDGAAAGSQLASIAESELPDVDQDGAASGEILEVPLEAGGEIIGRLHLWAQPGLAFNAEHQAFAGQVANSLALAIRHAQLFEQVENSRRQLQDLSRRLVDVQENERRAIARELHDEAGQSLTALKLGLGFLAQEPGCTETMQHRVRELREITDGVLDGLHRLSLNLRPASLDRLGLAAAVRQYVDTFRRRSDLSMQLEALGLDGCRYQPEIETTVYRVVQEALTNIARHAQARQVSVILERRTKASPNGGPAQDWLIAIVEDDGQGFDPDQAYNCGRLGLLGMRERAEMLGGLLTIESTPGSGTTVHVQIPGQMQG